jgi:predicted TIM-barrel fold metal-dependent hydrolase
MARNGLKIFDSDTHVGPFANVLEPYLTERNKKVLAEEWADFKSTGARTENTTYIRGARKYLRRLGEAEADTSKTGYMAGFIGAQKKSPSPQVDNDPHERIKDMDLEGVDVNLTLPSGWFGTFIGHDDVELETGMLAAYHQWMEDYCSVYPKRIGGVILCTSRDVAFSVEQIKKWGKSGWAWGILVYTPSKVPLDHPDIEPIWKAAADHDLAITLHTFTVMPPYAPGGTDNWENLFLQRSASHPWCGMRNVACIVGSGIMDRYPDIRVGCLEAGHSWLPFWMARLDEHARTIPSALPGDLKMLPSEYIKSGRFFQSIEIPEGGELTNMIIDYLGEDILMYASDYPHGESHFPESVDLVLDWKMSDQRQQKLMWNNACKLYARADV